MDNDSDTELSKMNSKISVLFIIKEKTEKFHEKIISKQIQSGNIFLWQQLIKKLRIQSVYLITVFGCVLFRSFLF